jgi:hypothetical protein
MLSVRSLEHGIDLLAEPLTLAMNVEQPRAGVGVA